MTSAQAGAILDAFLKEEYGRFLHLGEVETHRGAAGIVWRAPVLCGTGQEEFEVGTLAVDEAGQVVDALPPAEVVAAIRAASPTGQGGAGESSEEVGADTLSEADAWAADLAEELVEEGVVSAASSSPVTLDLPEDDPDAVWAQVEQLLDGSDEESLIAARELLPRMLVFSDYRAVALSELAWVEMQLGHQDLALDYLEAAAREFSDRADVTSLRLLCDKVRELVGEERYSGGVFDNLLRKTEARVQPVANLADVPVLSGLSDDLVSAVDAWASVIEVDQAKNLLEEGSPSLNVYFIRSGRMAVLVRTPSGGDKTITMLLPGDLVGESSVLSPSNPVCNATVRAEEPTSLWRIPGEALLTVFGSFPQLKQRLAAARELRSIHGFMSLHPTLGELEDQFRLGIIGCITEARHLPPQSVVIAPGAPPRAGYLVVRGSVAQRIGGQTLRIYGPDDFLGFRDSLHGIASECEFRTLEETVLMVFDGERMRTLALEAPPHVASVLERID